jgi:4'-phosphopantetheinyl transferase
MDTVAVWQVAPDAPEATLAALHATLDELERSRAGKFRQDADRRMFVMAHGAMRAICADRLGVGPHEIRWEYGPDGKPGTAGLSVNLSHSGAVTLVAVTSARDVGVDVQLLAPGLDAAGMARRYFTAEEAALVTGHEHPGERSRVFARIWARKEAVIKAAGTRLMRGIRVPVGDRGETAVDFTVAEEGPPRRFRVADLPVPDGYHAAVAMAGDDRYRVERLTWTPHAG